VTESGTCRYVTDSGTCRHLTEPGTCRHVTEPGSVKLLAEFYTWKVSILLLNSTHIRRTMRLIFWHKKWERIWKKFCSMLSASDRQ
jgi:hypothetical protein